MRGRVVRKRSSQKGEEKGDKAKTNNGRKTEKERIWRNTTVNERSKEIQRKEYRKSEPEEGKAKIDKNQKEWKKITINKRITKEEHKRKRKKPAKQERNAQQTR